MDKGLREYIKMTETWLKSAPHQDIKAFYAHHLEKTHEFQHERLIHLLVTFFFGFLFLFALATLFFTASLGIQSVTILATILAIVLFITEIFYIRYYYILENGVQKLYKIGDHIHSLNTH